MEELRTYRTSWGLVLHRGQGNLPSALLAAYFYGRCRLAAFMNMTVFWLPLHIFAFFSPPNRESVAHIAFCLPCHISLLSPHSWWMLLKHWRYYPPFCIVLSSSLPFPPFSSFQQYCVQIRAWLHLYTLGMMTSEPVDFLLQNWCKILLISCFFGTTLFLTSLS